MVGPHSGKGAGTQPPGKAVAAGCHPAAVGAAANSSAVAAGVGTHVGFLQRQALGPEGVGQPRAGRQERCPGQAGGQNKGMGSGPEDHHSLDSAARWSAGWGRLGPGDHWDVGLQGQVGSWSPEPWRCRKGCLPETVLGCHPTSTMT